MNLLEMISQVRSFLEQNGRVSYRVLRRQFELDDESPERSDIEWRIVRRYHKSDEDAHRWEASIAPEGPGALVVVSPQRIISWDYN